MIFDNGRISAGQLYKLLVTSWAGVSCLLVTDVSVAYGGQNGGLCVLCGALFTMLYGTLIVFLCSRVKWKYAGYAKEHFNKYINALIYLIFGIRYLLMLIVLLLLLLRLIKSELLSEISYPVLMVPVFLLMFYSVSRGVEARARLSECMFMLIVLALLILALQGIGGFDASYLRPAAEGGVSGKTGSIIWGGAVLFLLFSPIEMVLFMSDRLSTEKNIKKSVAGAVVTVIAVNIIYYIVIVGNLSANIVSDQRDAALRFVKNVKLPYLMFEKQGIFFLLFFMISLFLAVFCLVDHCTSLFCLALYAVKQREGDNGKSGRNREEKRSRVTGIVSLGILVCSLGGVLWGAHQTEYFKSILAPAKTRVQIEHRQYADSMLIDYDAENTEYIVYLSVGEKNSRSDFLQYNTDKMSYLKTKYTANLDKKLDLSHIETIILSKEILNHDGLLREVISYIDEDKELSDNLNICVTTQRAEGFVENAAAYTVAPGIYISKMVENNLRRAGTKFLSLLLVAKGTEKKCELSCFVAEKGGIRYIGGVTVSNQTICLRSGGT